MSGERTRQNGANNTMKRIESNVKQIPYSQESVYAKVSDLSNLRDLIDRIPEKDRKINATDFVCTPDSVSCSVPPVGKVEIAIASREPYKCVKMETVSSPIRLIMWIQIVGLTDSTCKIKITVDADINAFMAKMVEKPLTEAVDKLADALASVPY